MPILHPSIETSNNPDETPPWAVGTDARDEELAPKLDSQELETLRSYGHEQIFDDGAWLWRVGDRKVGCFIVLDGQLDIVARLNNQEHIIASHNQGGYGGEIVTMIGGGALVAGRSKGATRTIAVPHENVQRLIASEAELGSKILHSFILRRMRLIARSFGEVVLVGLKSDRKAANLRTFLSRNGVPHKFAQAETAADLTGLFEEYGVQSKAGPAVIADHAQFVDPSIRELAEGLGIASELDTETTYDLAVIGAGPSGLAAAVYGASEGLKTVVLESCAPGGQAGSSSRIENYPGFPTGISGQALTGRAFLQALKFGSTVAVARQVKSLECSDPFHKLTLDGGDEINARAVVLASGASYGQLDLEDLKLFEGPGIHYVASHIEGMVCRDKDVVVVGGGNSAGQAAMFLSRNARHVHILIRRESLVSSMSQYLIDRIERAANISVHAFSEVSGLDAGEQLQAITVTNNQTGESRRIDTEHLFLFIGAKPASGYAHDDLLRDDKGFIKTGPALSDNDLGHVNWSLDRSPLPLETSCARVFAVGDVRSGSVKRVASAVGEGSICIGYVHSVLNETGNSNGSK